MQWKVPGTKIGYRHSVQNGVEFTDDNGENWYFTFRSMAEVRQMHPTLIGPENDSNESERELFGETLDEEIPDDVWDMILGTC